MVGQHPRQADARLARRRARVHQPAHGREPSRRPHEEDGLALSFGADSLGALAADPGTGSQSLR